MSATYLLFFRAILAEILLLQSCYAPDSALGRWRLWGLIGLYALIAAAVFILERRRRLPVSGVLGSFLMDIVLTSLILHATGGFSGDFYIAYFLVILSTCFIDNLSFSFIVGGVACVVYSALAFPGLADAMQPFYLLRLSLLMAASFLSAYIAERSRRVQKETAAGYEAKLAWMQRLSAVGEALSRILHELKTPLGTISLSAEYVRERLRRGQAADVEGQLAIIEAEAERASAIVRGYLEFVRPQEIVLQPLVVQEPLAQALAAFKLRMEEQDVALESNLAGPEQVLGSRRHLVQLFTIVLDNAVHSMPLGGRLSVGVAISGGKAVVRFADTGVGLTPEAQSRLFAPFATSRSGSGGMGLGLSIARWIVLKHGGDIALLSPGPAKGTTVTVTLPLALKS